MTMCEWEIEIEIPAWVVIRGGTFDNREDAIKAYLKAKQVYRWPVRLRQIVHFQNYPDSTPFWRTIASSEQISRKDHNDA